MHPHTPIEFLRIPVECPHLQLQRSRAPGGSQPVCLLKKRSPNAGSLRVRVHNQIFHLRRHTRAHDRACTRRFDARIREAGDSAALYRAERNTIAVRTYLFKHRRRKRVPPTR